MSKPDNDQVVIVTSRAGAEILRVSIAHHALGIAPWAEIAGEQGEDARRILASVEAAKADVVKAIHAKDRPPLTVA